MAAKDWAGVAAGLALAGFGLGAYAASGPGPAPAPVAEPSPVVETVPMTENVVTTVPGVTIPGLSDAAGRVMVASGYAEKAQPADLGLSPSVIRVLEKAGTVLLIPNGDGS
ncbi:MAG: hypothetical protein KJ956_04290 [Actinobacteria bacterium]|nr:hypothetical protein [Actinomycetota bacterium]